VVENQNNNGIEQDFWSLYLYAMKSSVTREKYQKRLEKFFNYIDIEGKTIEEKSKAFVKRAKNEGNDWTFNSILKFMQFQLDRANKKETTGSTVGNYLKSIKLFCEMAEFSIAWKKISRGLPRAINYSDDRIPTIEEIRNLLEYPDRRIKAIIYTIASSGIRLGAWNYLKWGHIRPIEKEGEVVAAKIIIYGEEEDEYFSFISIE
jgi:integrase